ncbi:MAG: penicillin-binding protein 2 [Rikenellaceae bacterium]|jgi:penicillin-binding protein 2|nr:penicillin-binding protein 2 [Rikenellaceae bacterium]
MDSNRINILRIVVVLVALVILGRLFYIQVVDDRYRQGAQNNVLRYEVLYPARGEIYDRTGEFLVQSKEVYDLMVVPRDVKPFDTVLMCSILEVDTALFKQEFRKAANYSRRRPSILFKQLPKETKLKFEERHFPGFYTQYRTIRSYPRKIAGNLLGEVGEVGPKQIEADPWYRSGDYTGVSGIELAYEEELRGKKGVRVGMVDVYGVQKGSYADGALDSLATPGLAITSTIDARLQQLAEHLLEGKVGSVVAIEPATGEILVMASSPTFDPDELVGRERGKNYSKLMNDPRRPLFNRAVMSRYPPGSTFKLVNSLIALQEGTLTPSTAYACSGGNNIGGRFMACHVHGSPVDLSGAIQTSCNPYFAFVYRNLLENKKFANPRDGFDVWYDYVRSFGFGRKLDSDFTNEQNGYIPDRAFYDRVYNGRWNALTTVSLAIGQGEIGVSMLQLANFIATIANRGYYYIPHVIREVEGRELDSLFSERHYAKVDKKHFDTVAEAMWRAVNVSGTATAANIPGWDVCGKTGTAENPPWRDNSSFACFAPLNDPKIAISVYIENGGFGATVALPIARLLLEQYLQGEVSSAHLIDYVRNQQIAYPAYDRR